MHTSAGSGTGVGEGALATHPIKAANGKMARTARLEGEVAQLRGEIAVKTAQLGHAADATSSMVARGMAARASPVGAGSAAPRGSSGRVAPSPATPGISFGDDLRALTTSLEQRAAVATEQGKAAQEL